ncbi:hypothetical protein CVT25_003124 [Psilocybe cyanescens]|uniref:Uncharacterized protein n=1 Tax=Psilocybe cyanescens TaxID=93625 RepID=A0A409XQL1_PSICY|nr:hypothetical protein CVT25_003124 [Psilocybe cyanescens]
MESYCLNWRAHKEYCLKVKAAGENTFDAILFPVDELKPRIVKVPWKLVQEEGEVDWQKLDTGVWFNRPDKFVRSIYFDRWGINGPKLGRRLCFDYDDNALINKSPLNRCIVNITKGKAVHPWSGNILALRMASSSPREYDFYKSIDAEEDLRPLVTYFDEYAKDWRAHKEYCLTVKAAGENTFDAILFPVDELKPRLVKIPWKLVQKEGDVSWQKLDTDVWFKHPNKFVRSIYFDRWGINGPALGRRLCFKYDDNFMMNKLPLNRCIVNITKGQAGHKWCGNVVALRLNRSLPPYSYDFYESGDMGEDLKPLITYFDEYAKVKPV